MKNKHLAALVLIFSLIVGTNFPPLSVEAAVTLTPATGGEAISADTVGGAFTSLTGPVITESTAGEIPDNNSGSTITLNLPAGFEFDTTAGSVTATVTNFGTCGGSNKELRLGTGEQLQSQSVTPLSSSVTINVKKESSGSCRGAITFSGLKVRPTAAAPLASGNITKSGTAAIAGVSDGVTSFGTLTEVAGTAPETATLTLVKTVENSGGGTAVAEDFQAQIDGSDVPWGIAQIISVGEHLASELSLPGYTPSEWGGDCAADGSITAVADGAYTCNITNTFEVPPPSGTASISGLKFEDKNGNGVKDSGDNGLADWTINLFGVATTTAQTDANGNFSFNNLAAGNYIVCETMQAGWMQTSPVAGADCDDGTKGYAVTLGADESVSNQNFGNFKLLTVTGKKFEDLDNDGAAHETGEPFLPGWTIRLYRLGSPWVLLDTQITDGDGVYHFAGLSAGTYRVCEVNQTGWTQTRPAVSSPLTGVINNSPASSEEGARCLSITPSQTLSGASIGNQNFGNYHSEPTPVTYTLSYLAAEHGSIVGEALQVVNEGGSGTAVSANPDEGFHFSNWSDGSTANPRTDVNVQADITVTAHFAADDVPPPPDDNPPSSPAPSTGGGSTGGGSGGFINPPPGQVLGAFTVTSSGLSPSELETLLALLALIRERQVAGQAAPLPPLASAGVITPLTVLADNIPEPVLSPGVVTDTDAPTSDISDVGDTGDNTEQLANVTSTGGNIFSRFFRWLIGFFRKLF